MTGYAEDFTMSKRAKHAYRSGLKPISKFKKGDFMSHGLAQPVTFFKWLAKKEYWTPSEWHHTSLHYNETNFYSVEWLLEELADNELDIKLLLVEWRAAKKVKVEKKGIPVICDYIEWGGTSRHPRRYEHNNIEGILKGPWIYLKSGKRKSIDGKNIKYKQLQ